MTEPLSVEFVACATREDLIGLVSCVTVDYAYDASVSAQAVSAAIGATEIPLSLLHKRTAKKGWRTTRQFSDFGKTEMHGKTVMLWYEISRNVMM